MHQDRYGVRLLASLIISLASLNATAQTSRATVQSSSAEAAVQSFFNFHLAHDKSFTAANLERRRRWLTPELYRALSDEYHRGALERAEHPDDAPYIEGDPFTDTQDYPNSFRTGRAITHGAQAVVPITFYLNGNVLWRARVETSHRGRVWLIRNIVASGERDLLKTLREHPPNTPVK